MDLSARTEPLLGTEVEIKLPAGQEPLFSTCFQRMRDIESRFSRFKEDSELAQLNAHPGVWNPVSDEMREMLEKAVALYHHTQGQFDISVKEDLDRLGYDREYSFKEKPTGRPLAAQPVESWLEINRKNGQVKLGRQVDFGGFGKGYALDQVAVLLESHGVDHYYINAGGDIYAKKGPRAEPWKILLEHPDDASRAIGWVELDGQAIAGSSSNRRQWGKEKNLHHLLNAKTRRPATGMKAIFVTAPTGYEADAYATACFTAGFLEGIELSKRLPIGLLSISSENKMYVSPKFHATLF